MFCLNNAISHLKDKETETWLKSRVYITIVLMGMGFSFIVGAYRNLVDGYLFSSFRQTLLGLFIITILFLDTSLLVVAEKSET